MPQFETYECEQCGEEFRAYDGANASETEYCSPGCHEAAEGLDG